MIKLEEGLYGGLFNVTGLLRKHLLDLGYASGPYREKICGRRTRVELGPV